MSIAHEHRRISIIPAAFGGSLAVAAAGVVAAVAGASTVGSLITVALVVGLVSVLLPDWRAWLAATVTGALTFVLTVDENGWPYLAFVALAAALGRAQRWMSQPADQSVL
ncbi:hypothetical protein AB0J82_24965 [Asanoa sp. NPDC049518]|uniref:hypothetical protein n=1 Tax=unclassified Asanoa TaxID=2685164 RepID=UPI00343086A1